MTLPFYKYQGTGNDFILIDQRQSSFLTTQDKATIQFLCDRRFGIGADGLMFLEHTTTLQDNGQPYDFKMVYFNADGSESTMCGNGGRCLTAFAHFLGVFKEKCTFLAIDGAHEAVVKPHTEPNSAWVELKMIDVKGIETGPDYFLLNTGSPHFVVFVEDIDDINVFENGREIRYSDRFRAQGVNVNFVEEIADKGLVVATYERGVEAETLSCGTGVTAAAIAHHLRHPQATNIPIQTKGGQLSVHFTPEATEIFSNVWLCGPATRVFKGDITL